MYVLEATGKNTIVYMQFYDKFIDLLQHNHQPFSGEKRDIICTPVITFDNQNYFLKATTYSSHEFAEAEAKRISDTVKKLNPEKYPDGIKFRVMELWKVLDSDKIQYELKLLAIQNGFNPS